jgi:transposase-like protein
MNELEKEKMMVRGMKDSGMTLVEVARELGMNKSTVYTRYNELYAPVKVREGKKMLNEEGKLKDSITNDEKRLTELKEENAGIDKELNYSPHRTEEELIEYRKKRDKDIGVPGAVPEF